MKDSCEKEKRDYFRSAGTIYLAVSRIQTQSRNTGLENFRKKDAFDKIALKLMSFRAKLDYQNPEDKERFQEIADMLELLYHSVSNLKNGTDGQTVEFLRKPVIISGSGMEFPSNEDFSPHEKVALAITFSGYPYEFVSTEAEVIRIKKAPSHTSKHLVCVKYSDISEKNRDLIIKFVNHLQRKKIIERN